MAIRNWDGLEKVEKPAFGDVSRTLEICVKGGWAIPSQVVIGVIQRTQLRRSEKTKLLRLARFGARKQTALGHPMEVDEYRKVIASLV